MIFFKNLILKISSLRFAISLIIAGATAENLKKFLELRKFSQIIPTLSGIFLVALGLLNLFSNWI